MMKIRNGYVSNSSSASFIVFNANKLTDKQRKMIFDYNDEALKIWKDKGVEFKKRPIKKWKNNNYIDDFEYFIDDNYDFLPEDDFYEFYQIQFGFINSDPNWHIEENKSRNTIEGKTSMSNFNFEAWLKYIDVDFYYDDDY